MRSEWEAGVLGSSSHFSASQLRTMNESLNVWLAISKAFYLQLSHLENGVELENYKSLLRLGTFCPFLMPHPQLK